MSQVRSSLSEEELVLVSGVVDKLNDVFPLAERIASLSRSDRAELQRILRSYMRVGIPPAKSDLDFDACERLRIAGLVVFEESATIGGAYPFRNIAATCHSVIANGVEVGVMCALDALAVASSFNVATVVKGRVRGLLVGEQVEIHQDADGHVLSASPSDVCIGLSLAPLQANCALADSN